MKKLMAVLVIAGLATACTDQPTQPAGDEMAARAAQGDMSEWTLVATIVTPYDQAYVWGYVPCMNGGLGEDVDTWGGPYGLYLKTVTPGSGQVFQFGRLTIEPGGFDYLRGLTSGDVWVAGPEDLKPMVFHWRYYPDGASDAWGTFEETLTKMGSTERITLRTVQRYIMDASGNYSRADNHITSCRVLH